MLADTASNYYQTGNKSTVQKFIDSYFFIVNSEFILNNTSKEGIVVITINVKKFCHPNCMTIYPERAGKIDLENPIIEEKNECCVARNLPWQIEAIKAM